MCDIDEQFQKVFKSVAGKSKINPSCTTPLRAVIIFIYFQQKSEGCSWSLY